MMNYYRRLTSLLFILSALVAYCSSSTFKSKSKSDEEDLKYPSNKRKFQLYSKFGLYLTINEQGEVSATQNRSDPNTVLELQSYFRGKRRIRRPDSFYLAIDSEGYVTSMKEPMKETVFYEHFVEDNGRAWLWYQSYMYDYALALRTQKTLKKKLTIKTKQHKKKYEFLTILL